MLAAWLQRTTGRTVLYVVGHGDGFEAARDDAEYFRGRGCSELVGVWRDPETGVLCKIRLDRKIDRAEWIHTDIKTTANAFRQLQCKWLTTSLDLLHRVTASRC